MMTSPLFSCTRGILLAIMAVSSLAAQDIQSWRLGNANGVDIQVNPTLVLAGGGVDHDEAMRFMLRQATGGDVLILRSSGSDGYNSYFYEELGVRLNSVETIRILNSRGANDPYLAQRVQEAEVIFFAGGDQRRYYEEWKGTSLEIELTAKVQGNNFVLGGTSAGAMILGELQYLPIFQGVISSEALSDPYHIQMRELLYDQFFHHPWLDSYCVDTHFDQRNRSGRMSAFLARGVVDFSQNLKGIALNERTAIAINPLGEVKVFGRSNRQDTYAYFIYPYCSFQEHPPNQCEAGLPLLWGNADRPAFKVYVVKGDDNGNPSFNIHQPERADAGAWQAWYIEQPGILAKTPSNSDFCASNHLVHENNTFTLLFVVYPNPASGYIQVQIPSSGKYKYTLLSMLGEVHLQGMIDLGQEDKIDLPNIKPGKYLLCFQDAGTGKPINSYQPLIIHY